MIEYEKSVAWDVLKSAAKYTIRDSPDKPTVISTEQLILLMTDIEEDVRRGQYESN